VLFSKGDMLLHIDECSKTLNPSAQQCADWRKSNSERVGNRGDQEGVFDPAHFVHLDQTLYTAIKYVEGF
jgi:hypothetical protein